MNANELADGIEKGYDGFRRDLIVTLLRQQQAEIEALKQIIDANNLNQNIGQFVKPTNEPVAWMHQNPDYAISKHQSLEYNIPLYTHPVNPKYDPETGEPLIDGYPLFSGLPHPVKELTDEEIMVLYEEYIETQYASESNVLGFGRAILRKAQDK